MIKVCPRAGCSELFEDGSGLAARLKAAPEDGRANAELLRLLERTFKAEATIVRGRDSRRKTILLRN